MFLRMTKPKLVRKSAGLVFFLFLFLVVSSKSFAADKTPPSGSIKINNNSSYTSSSSVTLNLSATDKGSGMKKGKMRFSNDHSSWTSPENYKTTKSWSLASGDGTKTAYVKVWGQGSRGKFIQDSQGLCFTRTGFTAQWLRANTRPR